jgi:hypothetical protein
MIHQIIKAFDCACLPMTGSWAVYIANLLMWQMVTVKNMLSWLVVLMIMCVS